MPDATPASRHDESVLWDVVDEHLSELEFCVEQFESMLEHPLLTLDDLARGPERRLLAHLDGLVIGGAPVVAEVLQPALGDLDGGEPARVTALALALAVQREYELLARALFHEQAAVRTAAVRGCRLYGGDDLARWARGRWVTATKPFERASLLDVLAGVHSDTAKVVESLRSGDAALTLVAARVARFADADACLSLLESLLASPDVEVREAAMVSALSMGLASAWAECNASARDATAPRPWAMTLSAALGAPADHARLAARVAAEEVADAGVFALGFSGNPLHVPLLLGRLSGRSPLEAKLAAQAISTITGADLSDDAFSIAPQAPSSDEQEEEARLALPPLDEDVPDLLPPPEEALPVPNASALVRFWEEAAPRYDARVRYCGGLPFGPAVALDDLAQAPLRRRHALALAVAIRSGGRVCIDTRAFSAVQRSQLARARHLDGRTLFRHFAGQ